MRNPPEERVAHDAEFAGEDQRGRENRGRGGEDPRQVQQKDRIARVQVIRRQPEGEWNRRLGVGERSGGPFLEELRDTQALGTQLGEAKLTRRNRIRGRFSRWASR
jgi:hypothetical protein